MFNLFLFITFASNSFQHRLFYVFSFPCLLGSSPHSASFGYLLPCSISLTSSKDKLVNSLLDTSIIMLVGGQCNIPCYLYLTCSKRHWSKCFLEPHTLYVCSAYLRCRWNMICYLLFSMSQPLLLIGSSIMPSLFVNWRL